MDRGKVYNLVNKEPGGLLWKNDALLVGVKNSFQGPFNGVQFKAVLSNVAITVPMY